MSDSSSPSGRIISAANKEMQVTDGRGRVLRIRKLGALDRAKLFKAMGPYFAQNAPYLGMTMLAASVFEMDGIPLPFPSTENEVDAAIARLDDDGLDAVAERLTQGRDSDKTAEMEKLEAALLAAEKTKE